MKNKEDKKKEYKAYRLEKVGMLYRMVVMTMLGDKVISEEFGDDNLQAIVMSQLENVMLDEMLGEDK